MALQFGAGGKRERSVLRIEIAIQKESLFSSEVALGQEPMGSMLNGPVGGQTNTG